MIREDKDDSANLLWFLMGAAIGSACALLYAPKSGRETRDLISQRTQEASDTITGTSRDLYERGKDVYGRGKQVIYDAAALIDRVRKLARG